MTMRLFILTAVCFSFALAAATPEGRSEEPKGEEQKVGATHAPAIDYWQPEWMVRELWGPGRMPKGMMVRLLRHTTYIETGVPKEYDGAKSTLTPGPATTAAGAKLYRDNCAKCHGANGMGNGDQAQALSPSPALLGYMIRRPISVDEYLLWSISEGGKAFETAMPSFKNDLSRDDIWRIIAYMRAGFPELAAP